jgi:hypothetical protein
VSQAAAVAGAIGILIVLGGLCLWIMVRLAKDAGQAEAERDQYRSKAEQAERANEIDEAVSRLSDDDLDRELRGD